MLEYRAESYIDGELLSNPMFDKLSTWNENQNSDQFLLNEEFLPTSNLKGRYKVWRTFIPRDKVILNSPTVSSGYHYNKTRMMGTNLYIKLSSEGTNSHKTILKDVVVYMRK